MEGFDAKPRWAREGRPSPAAGSAAGAPDGEETAAAAGSEIGRAHV